MYCRGGLIWAFFPNDGPLFSGGRFMTASLARMRCRLAVLLVLQSFLFATAHRNLLIICYWIVLSLERFGFTQFYSSPGFHSNLSLDFHMPYIRIALGGLGSLQSNLYLYLGRKRAHPPNQSILPRGAPPRNTTSVSKIASPASSGDTDPPIVR